MQKWQRKYLIQYFVLDFSSNSVRNMKVLIVFAFIGVVQSNMTSPVVIIGGKNGGKMVMKEINDPKIGLLTTVLFSE